MSGASLIESSFLLEIGLLEEAGGMTSDDSLQRAADRTQVRRGLLSRAVRKHEDHVVVD